MTWKGEGLTDIGRVRLKNQDAFGLHNDLALWIIADGMGGCAGGEIASQIAVEETARYFQKQCAAVPKTRKGAPDYRAILTESIEAANQAIRDYVRQCREYTGMGTTAVAVHILDNSPSLATIAHSGDSRAYLIRDQALTRLTRDHSLVEEQIELGIITPDQAFTHPLRHILTRALGIESYARPTVTTIELTATDHLLLCTDGLTKMMTDQEILDTILESPTSLNGLCHALIKEANKLGGEDNVTVVMLGLENKTKEVL